MWTADFKGDFKTGDGWRCYPLTIHDGFSRYLFAVQGLDGTRFRGHYQQCIFGRDRDTEMGAVRRCDFSEATLHLCGFLDGCDLPTIRWPGFQVSSASIPKGVC